MESKLYKKIETLFSNLCCSVCKKDFDRNAINIVKKEKGLLTVNLRCNNCGKNFGLTFIGLNSLKKETEPASVIDGPDAISYNDVIDAHLFIKDLDEKWKKYLPKSN